MLQFRASEKKDINDAKCEIDCWIFPPDNPNGTTLRLAFYRFLVQGFRRCQGLRGFRDMRLDRAKVSLGYFNGVPSWTIKGVNQQDPMLEGWMRYLQLETGAFYWMKDEDPNTVVWETGQSWSAPPPPDPPVEMVVVPDEELEDLYGL